MVINFDKIGGGGGGTSNYNELSNKPQINNVTLSGNVSSDQLGITPNELKAVENVPSAATNGSVFAVASGDTLELKQAFDIPYTSWEVKDEWLFRFHLGSHWSLPSTDNVIALIPGSEGCILRASVNSDGFYFESTQDTGTTWTLNVSGITTPGYDDWLWDVPGMGNVNIQYESSTSFMFHFNGEAKTGYTLYTIEGQPDTDFVTYIKKSDLVKWFNYSDGNFTLVREDCTNNGDYLCHFGPEIEGSRSFKGVQCVNGEIDTTYTGWGMNHVGNGHMVGSTVDAKGVTYWAHAWSEGGKLYWELNTPVMDLDAYGTGSNKEGGLQLF